MSRPEFITRQLEIEKENDRSPRLCECSRWYYAGDAKESVTGAEICPACYEIERIVTTTKVSHAKDQPGTPD